MVRSDYDREISGKGTNGNGRNSQDTGRVARDIAASGSEDVRRDPDAQTANGDGPAHALQTETDQRQELGAVRQNTGRRVRTKGGLTAQHPSEYRTWYGMWHRCSNPSNPGWKHYGGRGIRVCGRWKKFETFLSDMGPKPTPKHSIDRIDNNGNYEPSNCRWATSIEQGRNRSNNLLLTYNGQTKTVMEWAESTGMGVQLIKERINRGWPIDAIFTYPKGKHAPSGGRYKRATVRRDHARWAEGERKRMIAHWTKVGFSKYKIRLLCKEMFPSPPK